MTHPDAWLFLPPEVEALVPPLLARLAATGGGSPANVNGWTTELTIRKTKDLAAVVQRAGVVADGAMGVLNFTLARADTLGLDAGLYVYDVWRKDTAAYTQLTVGNVYLS